MGRRRNTLDDMEITFAWESEPDKQYTEEEFMPLWIAELKKVGRYVGDEQNNHRNSNREG